MKSMTGGLDLPGLDDMLAQLAGGDPEPPAPELRSGNRLATACDVWDDQTRGRNALLSESVTKLIDEFAKLPGIGKKSAERLAYHVLRVHEIGGPGAGRRDSQRQGKRPLLPELL